MQLIGMLDSPFVRRVAISMLVLGVPFTHRSVSVFRGFDAFHAINPVVKAPTLVCADGLVLMDSTLILEYLEALSRPRSLVPREPVTLARALRVIGLSLAACEKGAQIVYERGLRPPDKVHQPWIDRVSAQLLAAFAGLETAVRADPPAVSSATLDQACISAAVAWRFCQGVVPGLAAADQHPALLALSDAAEALPEFMAVPYGEATVRRSA